MKATLILMFASTCLLACASDGAAQRDEEGYVVTGSNIPRRSAPSEVKSMGRTEMEQLLHRQGPTSPR